MCLGEILDDCWLLAWAKMTFLFLTAHPCNRYPRCMGGRANTVAMAMGIAVEGPTISNEPWLGMTSQQLTTPLKASDGNGPICKLPILTMMVPVTSRHYLTTFLIILKALVFFSDAPRDLQGVTHLHPIAPECATHHCTKESCVMDPSRFLGGKHA